MANQQKVGSLSIFKDLNRWVILTPLVLLLFLIPVVAWVINNYVNNQVKQEVIDDLETVVDQQANQIANQFVQYEKTLQVMQDNVIFAQSIKLLIEEGATQELKQDISRIAQSYISHLGFHTILVLDPQKKIVLGEGAHRGVSLDSQNLIQRALQTGHIQRSHVQHYNKRDFIDFIVPLFSDGKPVALVLARLSPESLFRPVLEAGNKQYQNSNFILLHSSSHSLHILNQDLTSASFDLVSNELDIDSLSGLLAEVNRQQQAGSFVGLDQQNNEVFAVYHPVSGTDWKLVASISKQDALSYFYSWLWMLMLGSMLALILVTILVWSISSVLCRKLLAYSVREQKDKERLLRSFFDLPFIGMAVISVDTQRCLSVNQRFAQIMGYSEQELLTMEWSNLTYPADAAETMKQYQRVLNGDIDFILLEKRYLRKSGDLVLCQTGAHALRAKDGSVERFCVMVQDLTEIKEQQKAQQENLAQFHSLVESIPLPLVLLKDNKLDYVNKGFVDEIGYELSAFKDIRHWWLTLCPEAVYREKMIGVWQRKQGSKLQDGAVEQFELTLNVKNGEAKTYIVYIVNLPKSIQWGQMLTLVDITERKETERSLRKLSLAVEQSPNTIVITDVDANIEYVNQAFERSSGYSPEEAIGRNPRILRSGKNAAATYQEMWSNLTRGEPWSGELINRRKDGYEYTESVLISPLREQGGVITNYVAIKENITARKQTEAELNERLDELRRWHDASMGREMRIIELKKEINELLVRLSEEPRYMDLEREVQPLSGDADG